MIETLTRYSDSMFLAKIHLAELCEDTNDNKDTHSQTTSSTTMDVNKRLFIDLEQVLISWEQHVHAPALRG